jgi:hypothetical protein
VVVHRRLEAFEGRSEISTCAGFGTAPATYIKNCSSTADCTSGCCVALTGSSSMICVRPGTVSSSSALCPRPMTDEHS